MQIEILKIEHDAQTGFIKNCNWRAFEVSGNNLAEIFDSTTFQASATMIPYSDVTEQNVTNWVLQSIDQTSISKKLNDQLVAITNANVATGFPWRKI